MSALPQVSPDWLVLRAAADDRSRSAELADAAAALLPPGRLVVHDLGSGSGAMMRWLAPRLAGPQRWVLHDADAGILEHRDPAPPVDAAGRPALTTTSVEQLAELEPAALSNASLVVASALLDVITWSEARTVVAACVAVGAPTLFSLTVAGRVELDPPNPDDDIVATAFNTHQRRDADGRRLLGPDAVGVVAGLFAGAGWRLRVVDTPWRLGSGDGELIAEWLDGWLDAAVEQAPLLRDRAEAFRAQRRAQLADGRLRVVIHHQDVLAWPA
ncbi:MAG TPA: SAM-dependent methyltransferase [Pseudolysinimonas sp.]|jgi:hypothetical protein